MIVLFCGDRNWSNFETIKLVLSSFPEDTIVVHGDSRGADKISGYLAKQRGLKVIPEPADWTKYGKAAGPIRNQLMLDKYKPTKVIAFHNDIKSSKGTKDMINRAINASIPVILFNDRNRGLAIKTLIEP